MLDFFYQQRYDFAILIVFIIGLLWFLHKNKKHIVVQKILSIGKTNLISMVMVRTTWGIELMKSWAKKYNGFVKFFGYFSIVIGAIGLLLNIWILYQMIMTMINQPQLQQAALVLPFTSVPGLGYLSFTHWIIAIAFLATIHEFAHGVVAKAHGLKIKASGAAILALWKIPVIPAAFVEPDEKKMQQAPHHVQHSVLAAGPVINLIVAVPLFFLLFFATQFVATEATAPVGFSFADINSSLPAANAGIKPGVIYDSVDGVTMLNATGLVEVLSQKSPGDEVVLGRTVDNGTFESYTIVTTNSPENNSRAFIGVMGLVSNREFIDDYKPYGGLITWFEELIRWLFMFNFLIGLMNLMPLFITDGGQIVRLYALKFFGETKLAKKVYVWICSGTFYIILAAFLVPLFF